MEGYSVTEAASVLGVPTERVWELLARGVLAGAPEGDTGMRVYLQPRPAPAARDEKPPTANGGGREPEREASPFRELLTEFRNLTERYGQALLALGEARGEVAALRSRVDLLEARMDLRLPSSPSAAPPAAWSSVPMPVPTERAAMPTTPVDTVASAEGEPSEVEEEEERRGRRRGPRRATESFAEALARAEDPSLPELPSGREAAAAIAATRPGTEAVDLGLPREVAAAEPVPVAEVDAGDSADGVEHEAAETEANATADATAVEPVMADATEPQPVELVEPARSHAEPVAEPDVGATDGEPEAQADPGRVAAVADTDAEPEVVAEPPAAASAPAPIEPPPTPAAEPLEWDSDRYTTDIEEPDWFAGEALGVSRPTMAQTDDIAEPASSDPGLDPEAEPLPDDSEAEAAPEIREDEAAPQQAERLSPPAAAEASGAEEMEVAAGQRLPTPVVEPPGLPGSEELGRAVAELNSVARPEVAGEPEMRPAEPEPRTTTADEFEADEFEADEWPPRSRSVSGAPAPTPDSVRAGAGTTGSASRAYRRLRRIFPG